MSGYPTPCVSAALALLLYASAAVPAPVADALSFAQESSLPDWVLGALRGARDVAPCSCLNPFYQRGDFDGDGRADYAVLVRQASSAKRGIAIVHRRGPSVHVLGAGKAIGNGGDDFSWMDAWRVFDRGPVQRGAGEAAPPTLRGDALLVQKTESASAILWWDGGRYRWYQQGD